MLMNIMNQELISLQHIQRLSASECDCEVISKIRLRQSMRKYARVLGVQRQEEQQRLESAQTAQPAKGCHVVLDSNRKTILALMRQNNTNCDDATRYIHVNSLLRADARMFTYGSMLTFCMVVVVLEANDIER